jgi:hypothetical protein
MFQGSVDKVTAESAVGWLYAKGQEQSSSVVAILNGRVIGHTVADLYRPDLEEVGFGDGRCGFEIRFSEQIALNLVPFVLIRPENSNLIIPATNNEALVDFVTSITQGFPGTGRNRSILGGLWTDRSDALKVLAGRVSIGLCNTQIQQNIHAFISDGYVLMNGAYNPDAVSNETLEIIHSLKLNDRETNEGVAQIKQSLTRLAELFFGENLTGILQSIFDDHPVAYGIELLKAKSNSFAQICTVEELPSPAECVVLYISADFSKASMEIIHESHELPEFTRTGRSRWTNEGSQELTEIAIASGRSIETIDINAGEILLVGPGLMHRSQPNNDARLIRIFCAPRRVTPKRFLTGNFSWFEVGHPSGARLRL